MAKEAAARAAAQLAAREAEFNEAIASERARVAASRDAAAKAAAELAAKEAAFKQELAGEKARAVASAKEAADKAAERLNAMEKAFERGTNAMQEEITAAALEEAARAKQLLEVKEAEFTKELEMAEYRYQQMLQRAQEKQVRAIENQESQLVAMESAFDQELAFLKARAASAEAEAKAAEGAIRTEVTSAEKAAAFAKAKAEAERTAKQFRELEAAMGEARRSSSRQAQEAASAREVATRLARLLETKEAEFKKTIAALTEQSRRAIDSAQSEAEQRRSELKDFKQEQIAKREEQLGKIAAIERSFRADIAGLQKRAAEAEASAAAKEAALRSELATEKAKALADAKAAAERAAEQLSMMDASFEEARGKKNHTHWTRSPHAARSHIASAPPVCSPV